MLVRGARKTITYQAFEAQVSTDEDGGKTLVFIEADGTAHAFAVSDDARDRMRDELASAPPVERPIVASPADVASLGKNGQEGGA